MSVSAAKGASKFGLRDRREPGHFWADNEIFDVFGDLLGANGILLYMTMARLCRDAEVNLSLDEIAAHSRQSRSTVDRTMKRLVEIGLIEEQRSGKVKTKPVYQIVNAKRLAANYVAQRLHPTPTPESIPQRDSDPTPPEAHAAKPSNDKASFVAPTLVQLLYPTVGQMAEGAETVDKKICPQDSGTDLSHPDVNLSHTDGPFNTKETRLKEQVLPPTPQGGSGAVILSPMTDVQSESSRVMRECTLSDPRLKAVVAKAMWQAMEANRKHAGEVADTMIRNHAEYVRSGPLLRFTWGPRKFFAEGHWLNWQGWPLDQKLLAESRRF